MPKDGKIEENIYYDSRCKNAPFCLGIMRGGIRLTKSYLTLSEARRMKTKFLGKMEEKIKPRVDISVCKSPLEIVKVVKTALLKAGFNKYYVNDFIYEALDDDYENLVNVIDRYVEVINE